MACAASVTVARLLDAVHALDRHRRVAVDAVLEVPGRGRVVLGTPSQLAVVRALLAQLQRAGALRVVPAGERERRRRREGGVSTRRQRLLVGTLGATNTCTRT